MSNLTLLSDTIIPWLMGALLMVSFVAILLSMKQWRSMKRSPYFFMRQQAGKRMQTYMSLGAVMLLLALAVGTYGYRSPLDMTSRMALLSNAKPADAEVQKIVAQAEEDRVAEETAAAEATGETTIADLLLGANASNITPELPAAFDRYEPTADLLSTTDLGTLVFSTEVTTDYDAIDPGRVFGEGSYTLYATFDYSDMTDGMEWAWVWRLNGKVIDGGNELWAYGDEGPGYIYLSPEEGFLEGNYTLEIWVNGELMSQGAALMNDAAVAAGN